MILLQFIWVGFSKFMCENSNKSQGSIALFLDTGFNAYISPWIVVGDRTSISTVL